VNSGNLGKKGPQVLARGDSAHLQLVTAINRITYIELSRYIYRARDRDVRGSMIDHRLFLAAADRCISDVHMYSPAMHYISIRALS